MLFLIFGGVVVMVVTFLLIIRGKCSLTGAKTTQS